MLKPPLPSPVPSVLTLLLSPSLWVLPDPKLGSPTFILLSYRSMSTSLGCSFPQFCGRAPMASGNVKPTCLPLPSWTLSPDMLTHPSCGCPLTHPARPLRSLEGAAPSHWACSGRCASPRGGRCHGAAAPPPPGPRAAAPGAAGTPPTGAQREPMLSEGDGSTHPCL